MFALPNSLRICLPLFFPRSAMLALPRWKIRRRSKMRPQRCWRLRRSAISKIPSQSLPRLSPRAGFGLQYRSLRPTNGLPACSLGWRTSSSLLEFNKVICAAAHQVRFQLRLAAGEAGLPCFDSAFANFKDEEGFVREAQMARSLGFAGKSCIHPGQIALANRIFSPSSEEIAAALRCVKRHARHDGRVRCVCIGWAHGRCAIHQKG